MTQPVQMSCLPAIQLMLHTVCSFQAHRAIPLTQQASYGLTFHQLWHHAGVQFWARPLA